MLTVTSYSTIRYVSDVLPHEHSVRCLEEGRRATGQAALLDALS